MGHVSHDAFVITADHTKASIARDLLGRLGIAHVETTSQVNGYITMFVGTSGSKSGWNLKDKHTSDLRALAKALRDLRYDDGSSSFEWSWMRYGSDDAADETDPCIVDHEWADR